MIPYYCDTDWHEGQTVEADYILRTSVGNGMLHHMVSTCRAHLDDAIEVIAAPSDGDREITIRKVREPRHEPSPEAYPVTKDGTVLTPELLDRMAADAERGIKRRK